MNRKLTIIALLFLVAAPVSFNQVSANDVTSVLKDSYGQAKVHNFNRGDTRGLDHIFQAKIDLDTPLTDQVEMNNTTRELNNGKLKWTFNAKDHLYSWIDLNDDGIQDAIMLFYHTAYCGTVGCEGFVFLSQDDQLEFAHSLTIYGETVRTNRLSKIDNISIFSRNECLIWTGEKYQYYSGYTERFDGFEDWNPHACGNHFEPELLKVNNDCQSCHH